MSYPKPTPGSRRMNWGYRATVLAAVVTCALGWAAGGALAAQAPVGLGSAGSFAVLAGTSVSNTGPSTLNGDLGVSPGTAISGFPPGTVNGATHATDAVAQQAQSDLTTAYNDAAGRTPAVTVVGDLGGLTLTPGVYRSASSLGLTGQVTLDAQGDPNAVFIFQAGSTLTTASASSIDLINGAQPCNVYWEIGSSATLGDASTFVGNVLAYTSVSINNNVTVAGRVLARNGAVTLINDAITPSTCATTTGGGTTGGGTTGGGTTGATPGAGTSGSGISGGPAAGNGTSFFAVTPRAVARQITRYGTSRCVHGSFRVSVTGLHIRAVVFSLGRQMLARRTRPTYDAVVRALGGIRTITARVTYNDATRPTSFHLRFEACAAATLSRPHPSRPVILSGFTG